MHASAAVLAEVLLSLWLPQESEIPFGACVWATGVAMHPLVKTLSEKLPPGTQVLHVLQGQPLRLYCWMLRSPSVPARHAQHDLRRRPRACACWMHACPLHARLPVLPVLLPQTHFRSAITDEFLRVKGSNDTIFALGDAATIEQQKVRRAGRRAGRRSWGGVCWAASVPWEHRGGRQHSSVCMLTGTGQQQQAACRAGVLWCCPTHTWLALPDAFPSAECRQWTRQSSCSTSTPLARTAA